MFRNVERNDVLNVAGAFLAAYGWTAFLCFFHLMMRWEHSSPTTPDPVHGYIYPHNEHGWITYFSAFQTTSCALLFATSIPLFFMGALVMPKRNVVYRRGFLSIGAKWDPDDPKKLLRISSVLGATAAPVLVFVFGPYLVTALNEAGLTIPFN